MQCDIDEQVTRMAEKYFPSCANSMPTRAPNCCGTTGYLHGNCAPGSVDIVIVDSTDWSGPAEGLFNRISSPAATAH